jgi:hypothetical protein
MHIYNCFGQSWCEWPEYNGGGLWIGDATENNVVYRSTDGGKTVTPVPGLLYATYVGFGKGTESTSAVYVIGMNKNGTEGLFRSTDSGNTWTQLDDAKHKYGGMKMVTGDPCIYSRIYITGSGRGIIYYNEKGNSNTCADRIDK